MDVVTDSRRGTPRVDAMLAHPQVAAAVDKPFTVSQAGHALGATRRVTVPLLEHLDAATVTIRLPDYSRRLRRANAT